MANLTITNDDFQDGDTILDTEVDQNFDDIKNYINNRNSGSATWDKMKVSDTTTNPVDIASSASTTEVTIDNTATDGDPVLGFNLSGTRTFSLGVDDGDSDTFKIGTTAIGTNTGIKVDSSGNVFFPNQPCFLVYNNASQDDVTGDSTVYTIQFNTEVFDQGGDFASNTFTAPVTGKYLLQASVRFHDVASGHGELSYSLVTSNQTYTVYKNDLDAGEGAFYTKDICVIADMDASDTATITISVTNSTKVIDVDGGNPQFTRFSGMLVA